MGAGLGLLALMISGAGHATSWTLVPGELIAGMGMGIALPPLFDFILAGVQEHEVGSASGVLNASQQFAGALGRAVFATIFFSYLDAHRAATGSAADTILLTLIPVALAFVAVFRLPRRAREGAGG
jgi:hypothetical protein